MKTYLAIPAALTLMLLGGTLSPAQFGRPSYTPRPVFRPPVRTPPPHMPTHTPTHTPGFRSRPHVPTHTPGFSNPAQEHQSIAQAYQRRQEEALRHAENTKRAAQFASTVGLLATPGQGPLLEPSTLSPGGVVQTKQWRFTYHPPADPRKVAQAASSVGLLASSQGQGPLLRAATLFPEPVVNHQKEERVEGPMKLPPIAARDLPEQGNAEPPFFLISAVLLIVFFVLGIFMAISRIPVVGRKGAWVRVRIKSTPPGDAPRSIRQAWVGLELRVRTDDPVASAVGVLSNRSTRCNGSYSINGAEAVALLAESAPSAATWWQTHAPHVLRDDYQLVFPAEVCDVL